MDYPNIRQPRCGLVANPRRVIRTPIIDDDYLEIPAGKGLTNLFRGITDRRRLIVDNQNDRNAQWGHVHKPERARGMATGRRGAEDGGVRLKVNNNSARENELCIRDYS